MNPKYAGNEMVRCWNICVNVGMQRMAVLHDVLS